MIWRSVVTSNQVCSAIRYFHTSTKLLAEALRDEAIRARYVRIVDHETGSLSSRAQSTQQLLRQIDRTRFWLVQVKASKFDQDGSDVDDGVAANGAEGSSGGGRQQQQSQNRPPRRLNREETRHREEIESRMDLEDLAIVKLVDKKEAYDKQKAHKLKKKENALTSSTSTSSASSEKEGEMTWSSTSNDIEHKLKALLTHLKKRGPGARVKVRIKAKQGKGKDGGLEMDQKQELVQKIEDYLCNWEQASEGGGGAETLFHARRVGEVEWQKGNSVALMRFEVIKGRSKYVRQEQGK